MISLNVKNAEVAVKEQAETFSAIIENANESIWLLSPDLKVLQFNKTAKERLQLNRGKEIYIGANFKEFLYIGTENVFMPMFNEALAGRYIEEESSQLSIHGNTFWLRTKMYPVYDTQKKLIGVTVLSENITNRKEIEIALAQSEERNRALVEKYWRWYCIDK
ncbi:MAG: PAS domain S-box protein [Ferruginibacter sp.]